MSHKFYKKYKCPRCHKNMVSRDMCFDCLVKMHSILVREARAAQRIPRQPVTIDKILTEQNSEFSSRAKAI